MTVLLACPVLSRYICRIRDVTKELAVLDGIKAATHTPLSPCKEWAGTLFSRTLLWHTSVRRRTSYHPYQLPPSPATALTSYRPLQLPPSPPTALTSYRPHQLLPSPPTALTSYRPHHLPPSPATALTSYRPHHLPPSPATALTTYRPHHLPSSRCRHPKRSRPDHMALEFLKNATVDGRIAWWALAL